MSNIGAESIGMLLYRILNSNTAYRDPKGNIDLIFIFIHPGRYSLQGTTNGPLTKIQAGNHEVGNKLIPKWSKRIGIQVLGYTDSLTIVTPQA